MEENTQEKRPDLMVGKKILYVHGFGSSGATGSARGLRILLPNATVISPDLPVRPTEAMELLHNICKTEKPDMIIGSSMGGMYTEMLYGFDRLLVNPAFQIADTMAEHNMMGRVTFSNPRQDGAKDFLVNKVLQNEFREVSGHCFVGVNDEERSRVFALYGIHDDLVHTFDLFTQHYPQAIRFDGGHYLNDHVLVRSVLPVVQWVDDRQEHRERPILYISIEDTLRKADGKPMETAVKAFHKLAAVYDIYILASASYNEPESWAEQVRWVEQWLGVPAYNRLILSNHKNLSYGDYLIDAHTSFGTGAFMGTHIQFGKDPYRTWEDVMEFFDRLGGQ
ncbi:MAG: esterase [Bacteroidaceae bacterium]|nr:esterase [Bacteroidaceae bacterium]